MEYQNIINFLDNTPNQNIINFLYNTPNQPCKFRTKNWFKVNYDLHGT